MKTLKVGIIGLGVGEKHIADFESHPECEVVALCDMSEDRLAVAKKKYSGKKFMKDANELIDDPGVDVVSIASYDNYHFEHVKRCIENDKHIFIEKPLCQREEELKDIQSDLEKKPHLKISSNLVLRMSSRFRSIKRMIEDGEMGDLFYVEGDYNYGRLHKITEGWRGKLDFYSVMCGGGVHIIDLLLWLTEDTVVEVMAYGNQISSKDSNFKYNDMVTCLLKFQSGMIGKIAVNFGCVMPHYHNLTVYGTKATFVNGLDAGRLYQSREKDDRGHIMEEPYKDYRQSELITSFIDSIVKGSTAMVEQQEVFSAMSVCFAAEKSLKTGVPVSV